MSSLVCRLTERARWGTGTCFPESVLGHNGYLATHQKHIRRLSLVTQTHCEISKALPLTEFGNVRELIWRGLAFDCGFNSVKDFLHLHHEGLESLELDLVNWDIVQYGLDRTGIIPILSHSTPLIALIIPNRDDADATFLPGLRRLSLSYFTLQGSPDSLINALNLCGVEQLRLLKCDYAMDLLNYAARSGITFRATKVELVLHDTVRQQPDHTEGGFLGPFDSLKEVFLMFESGSTDKDIFTMISRHQKSLRRLIYHRRHMDGLSIYGVNFYDSSLERINGSGLAKLLSNAEISCLGVCDQPSRLRETLRSVAPRLESLRLLHLRFSGHLKRRPKFFKDDKIYELPKRPHSSDENFLRGPRSLGWWLKQESWRDDEQKEVEVFADWAFGHDGFPNLQVLASGDFSHGNRFADTRTLWCRSKCSLGDSRAWRKIDHCDIIENKLVDANMDMLSACEVQPLFLLDTTEFEFPGIS